MASDKPYVSPELIKFLNKSYPLRLTSLDVSERQLWYDVGARSVVEHLMRLHSEQVQRDLGSSKE